MHSENIELAVVFKAVDDLLLHVKHIYAQQEAQEQEIKALKMSLAEKNAVAPVMTPS